MAKKTKRFKQGDIVVNATKPISDSGLGLQNLDYRLPRMDGGGGGGMGGGGGGRGSITPTPLPAPASSRGPVISPAVIRQPSSTLGQLSGTAAPKGYGVSLRGRFKKGGSVSSASKRADGCATQGKTKGKFV